MGKNKAELIAEAKNISKHFNRRVCLVMSPKQAFYIELDGTPDFESNDIPAGGIIL